MAGDINKYKVKDIPVALLNDAEAVVRIHEEEFVRESLTEAVLYVKDAITILDRKALDEAVFYIRYNQFYKIRKVKITIFDEHGEVVKSFNIKELNDVSAYSGSTLFSDTRIKHLDPGYRTLPFTIEFIYEIDYSGFFWTPDWDIYPGYHISVESSSFTITTPTDLQLNYYQHNTSLAPVTTQKDGNISLSWQVCNLAAIDDEPYSVSFSTHSPIIFTSPSNFSIQGYEGNFDNWKNFGSWMYELNNGLDDLPEDTKVEIKSLINDTLSEYEVINILYQWMQHKVRYVSVQIGIGGWQPISASLVDKYAYGDCKALANYMYSILKVAGIPSYYTLVRAGHSADNILVDFPCPQFNHAILCVPTDLDTLWLECTSQEVACGYIGDFTDDRDVLLITEDGGKIVHTKVYNKEENFKTTQAVVKLDNKGDGIAKINVVNSGSYYNERLGIINSQEKERSKLVTENLEHTGSNLEFYSFEEINSRMPLINETMDLSLKKYGIKLGNRILFDANLANKTNPKIKVSDTRKLDIVIRNDLREVDTITYILPDSYVIESLPPPCEMISEFGKFQSRMVTDSTQVVYIRNFEINRGVFPKESYAAFKLFFDGVRDADNQKIVLVNGAN